MYLGIQNYWTWKIASMSEQDSNKNSAGAAGRIDNKAKSLFFFCLNLLTLTYSSCDFVWNERRPIISDIVQCDGHRRRLRVLRRRR